MPGMIVAPQPEAVDVGARVLATGGNAFDAALACAFVQFLVDPHSCGIGGYLVMTYHRAGQTDFAPILDAPALAGSKVSPSMWENVLIGPNPRGWGFFLKDKVNEDGYHAICIPGIARGLQVIHDRWCTRSVSDLMQSAVSLADDGWVVSANRANMWKEPPSYYAASSNREKLDVTPEARRIYLKDGRTYEMGEVIRNPDYATTLRRIAEAGFEDMYTGQLAETMSNDIQAHGGWVTADDLAWYKHREAVPVTATYRGFTVVSNQPPHGGPTLAAILNILEGYDLVSLGHNTPRYVHLVSMAMKAAFADRNANLADPEFEDVPLDWLISKERAAEWRNVIDSGEPIQSGRRQHDSPDTTHLCVVDAEGNCVSLTHSLGTSSGVISPGLGFMYNNSMVNFEPTSGHPNSIAARKGRTTGMTPTIVYQDDRPVLVIGAPGATRIITSILQVILNRIDFGMSISDAVHAPRFDCQGDSITCQSRIPESVCAEVRKRHPIERLPRAHGGMGLVQAIAIDLATGALSGASDTGGEGMALAVL
ncbi:MAG: gamma-glutamyltransferase family protein [Planctomycetota bacterium]|nr:gamma-glutamyltransferase family protein [Planctomycetota bacterium]